MHQMNKVCDADPIMLDDACSDCGDSLYAETDNAIVAKDPNGKMLVYCVPCGEKVTE